ncbi:MAG TPA: type II toxin-antitoxin system VapC family toxin [Blastocatellia bacterium]|nr:type II toxin-antitoxin system VapC family toxin [Blastocatellia bacterium]
MRYYLDSAPIIYLVEQVQPYATAVRRKLSAQGLTLITSELTRLECRVKPLRNGDAALLQDFDDYFANSTAEIIQLTREVIDRATEIRAQFNFKTPDSIQLAAAVVSNSDVFLTNDHRLNRFTGITIEVI